MRSRTMRSTLNWETPIHRKGTHHMKSSHQPIISGVSFLLAAAILGGAPARAGTLYQTGFESPPFTAGQRVDGGSLGLRVDDRDGMPGEFLDERRQVHQSERLEVNPHVLPVEAAVRGLV